MSRIPVQMARMSADALAAYVGPPGEQIYNLDTKRTHFQDGMTPGGNPTRLMTDLLAGEVRFDAAMTLTDAQKALVQTNIGVVGNRDGCCSLYASASDTVTLAPYSGERLVINGRSYVIPGSGIVWKAGSAAPTDSSSILTGQALTAGTTYYVYVFADATSILQLELSTVSRTSFLGYQVKFGDPSRRLVGMVRWHESGSFTAVAGQVLNWFNRSLLPFASGISGLTTGSTSDIILGAQVSFLAWASTPAKLYASGYALNNSANSFCVTKLYTDATLGRMQIASNESVASSGTANVYMPLNNAVPTYMNQDGWHTSAVGGRVSGGTGTFNMNNYVEIIG